MRSATVGLIAAVLALAGCKSTEKGDDKPFGGFAGRPKTTPVKDKDKDTKPGGSGGLSWLEDGKTPGAGASVPKGGAAGNPTDPNFNPKAAAQDALGGRVLDPLGRPARNVAIHMEPVGGATADLNPADIDTNNEGYFFVRGLKAGHAYDVTAQAVQGGKPLTGSVQTKVPNPILLIVLRDDLPVPSGGAPLPKGMSDTFPPAPRPTDGVSGVAPKPPATKPNDGAWSPGGTISGVPPATINGGNPSKPPASSGGPIPQPDDLTPAPATPEKRENVAEGPKPFKPPALNVPGGPPSVPPLPALPPSFNKSGGKSSMNNGFTTGSSAGKVALLDSLERPWELSSASANSLVLMEFITSECEYSRDALPGLQEVQRRYGASGLQVVAVLCDELPQKERAARALKYGRDNNLNFAVYVEPGDAGGVRDRFGVKRYPTAFLLTPGGKVLWTGHPGEQAELDAAIKQNLGK